MLIVGGGDFVEIMGLALGGMMIGGKLGGVVSCSDFRGLFGATIGLGKGGHVNLVCVLMERRQIMCNDIDVESRIENIFV